MQAPDAALVADRLADLRAAYGAALPAKLRRLRDLAHDLDPNKAWPQTRAALEEIRAGAHMFAGSAPTFGFGAVGQAARAVERLTDPMLRAVARPSPPELRALRTLLDELVTQASDAATPGAVLVIAGAGETGPLLAARLESKGHRVVLSSPGQDASAIADAAAIQAVLVQADALARLETLRWPAIAPAPIIAFAQSGDFASRYAASRAGAIGFLADPLGMPDLTDQLAALTGAAACRVLYAGPQAPVLDPDTMRLEIVADPAALLETLASFRPAVLLLDAAPGGYDAVDLARMVVQAGLQPDPGIFFLARDAAQRRTLAARGIAGKWIVNAAVDGGDVQACIRNHLAERRTVTRTDPAPSPAEPTGKPRRKILIVDDDRYLVAVLAHALAARGADVLRAYTGEDGYVTAWQERPSAVITDVEMPNGSGDRMILQMRGNPRTRDIPVIVMTQRRWEDGKDYALERELCGRLGASAYLQKPVMVETLVKELARL
jgi:DNA-binding response OmpR family regulator